MSNSDVAAAIAAGRVPAGITEAYLDQSRDGPSIAAIAFVFCLTAIVVISRACTRAFLLKRFGLDDGLALFSLILLSAFVGLCVVLIDIGSGRHYDYIQYVMTMPVVEESEVLDFAAHLIYTMALLLCRISGLAFYYRICGQHKRFAVAIKVMVGVLIAGFLPQIFLIIFHCIPVTGLWPYAWQPNVDEYTCLQWGVVYSVNSGVSLFCDALVFGIPITMMWILDLPRKRKIQLACILLPGVLVIAISITRLIFVIQGQWEADESWSYDPMLAVETSEIGATLIALSVPGIKPLVDRVLFNNKDHSLSASHGRGLGARGSRGYQIYGGSSSTGGGLGGSQVRGTALRNLSNQRDGEHGVMGSSDDVALGPGAAMARANSGKDDNSLESQDGILVRVDFNIKEARMSQAV